MTAIATTERLPSDPERWRDKHGIAEYFSCGIRWIELRMAEGMPYAIIAGKAKFRISEVEPWLVLHGFIEWVGEGVRV
jgi:hypothetical protein